MNGPLPPSLPSLPFPTRSDLQAKCCVHPLPFFVSEQAAADPQGLSIRQQLDAAVADAGWRAARLG